MEARYAAWYHGGMKYSTGSCFNFSVAAGISEVIKIRVGVAGEIDGLNVSNATFRFSYQSEGCDIESAIVEHNGDGCLGLHIPTVGSGEYRYVLDYVDSLGQNGVLLYGRMTAISRVAADELTDKANAAEMRVLEVMAGSIHSGPLELRWAASSVAALYAEAAKEAAKDAEAAASAAEGFKEDVSDTLRLVQAFMASFNKALFEAIRVVDNYLWVGGVNTGHYLRGQDGITPHIGTDGYWYVGTKRLGDRPAFGKDGITPHITADGFWAFGETKTTVRAEGRDGIDGTAVRRILVGSYEEIPQSGETCNGGFLYYVPAGVERAQRQVASLPTDAVVSNYNLTGPLVFSESRTWTRRGGRLMRFGLMAGSNTQGGEPSEELLYVHLYYELAGVWYYAGRSVEAVAQAVNAVSWWDFEELEVVPRGCRVKVVLSQVEAEPTEEQMEAVRIQVAAVATTEGSKVGEANFCAWAYWGFETEELTAYDVYAWCESDGAGSWVRVDLNYDIATSRLYGLTKLGMDQVVRDGAPVGVNAAGQMAVPLADAALPGSVMPASATADAEGGQTFVRDGRMWVRMANLNLPGVGKTSYTRVVPENTNSIGLTEDGKFAVPRAAAFQWGVSKVGSSVPQSNGMPWIIPVAMAETGVLNEYGQDITGQLMNNVLVGGALRTATKNTWLTWGPNGINVNLLPDGSNAVGLMTSVQFTQSAAAGLELLAATTELLAGVYLARDKNDSRAAAVVTPGTLRDTDNAVRNWVKQNYYTKEQVPTKETLTNTLSSYVTKSTADATYASKKQLNDLSAGVVHKADPYIPGFIMTEEEYNALGSNVDPNLVYIQV